MKRKYTKAELLERRALIAERRSEILTEAEKEGKDGEPRELTEEEIAELEKLRNEQAIIQARIDELEAKKAMQEDEDREVAEDEEEQGIDDPAQRKMIRVKVTERRSATPITQLIRGKISGKMAEEVRGIAEAGKRMHSSANLGISNECVYLPVESRATLQAAQDTLGKETIATDMLNILDPIRDNLVVAKSGATILTGLVSNLDVPTYSGSTASWEAEIAKAKDGGGTFSVRKMSPKRLATTINVSRQLLLQDSVGVEQMLLRDIVASIYTKLETTMFSADAGSDGIPAGLLNGKASAGTVSSYETLIDLYTKLRNNLYWGQNIKGVTNPNGYSVLAKTPIMANVAQGFLVDGNKLATGHEIFDTTAVKDGLILADFTQLLVGQWGAIELKVDDTTLFDEGIVRLMVNSYWDFKFRDDDALEWGTVAVEPAV